MSHHTHTGDNIRKIRKMHIWSNKHDRSEDERGNVLFLILIAVVLFAALSYAVVQSTRMGSGNTSKEKNAIRAAQLIQYGDYVATAVMRIRTIGKYDKSQISFENNGVAVNPNCTEPQCQVFHPQGGGVPYWNLTEDWRGSYSQVPFWRWHFSKNNQFHNVGTDCAAAACNDVVLLYRGITREVCIEVNNKIGINNPGGEPPENIAYTDPDYVGVLDYYNATYVIGSSNLSDPESTLNGQYVGCFYDPDPTDVAYHFYRIVIEN